MEETFIGDIVAAMNKDELPTPPAKDTDLNWLFHSPDELASSAHASDQELRDMFSGLELAVSTETSGEELPIDQALLDTSLEPSDVESAAQAEPAPTPSFEGLEPAEIAALTAAATPTPGQMWRDPR